ncbi:MAG: hypothetical protein NTY77_04880 [Elusimicrobia bacterium]|nr:hypothetical protein [Elusimicrobiota bacterium]
MQPGRQLWVVFFLLGLLALLPRPSAAQDTLSEPQASEAFLWPRALRNYVMAPVEDIRELSPFAGAGEEGGVPLPPRSFLGKAQPPAPSRLILFTRLAGMFMGRVSPLSVGGWRLCFKLDIL